MKIHTASEETMLALGGNLARACTAPAVIYLHGQLGAGKTTLVRGFLRGLDYVASVRSPTYTLIEPYDVGQWRVYHLDLYRVEASGELAYLGLRDLLESNVIMLVEWPERGSEVLPSPDIVVTIDYSLSGRDLIVTSQSLVGNAILEKFASLSQYA